MLNVEIRKNIMRESTPKNRKNYNVPNAKRPKIDAEERSYGWSEKHNEVKIPDELASKEARAISSTETINKKMLKGLYYRKP